MDSAKREQATRENGVRKPFVKEKRESSRARRTGKEWRRGGAGREGGQEVSQELFIPAAEAGRRQ